MNPIWPILKTIKNQKHGQLIYKQNFSNLIKHNTSFKKCVPPLNKVFAVAKPINVHAFI